jgi:hypothetical protein
MITSWKRALPVQRALLAYGADRSNPILINDFIIIPGLLLLYFFRYHLLGPSTSGAR